MTTVYRTLKRIPGSAAADVSDKDQAEATTSPKATPPKASPSDASPPDASPAKAKTPARSWFVVEAFDLDDPDEAVVGVSSHASESAAKNALRRQLGKPHGKGVLFAVRHASDIRRHRTWDGEQARAVIRLGPPFQ